VARVGESKLAVLRGRIGAPQTDPRREHAVVVLGAVIGKREVASAEAIGVRLFESASKLEEQSKLNYCLLCQAGRQYRIFIAFNSFTGC
jgi:hypothetical protein